jgi:hypothetical protein
MGRGAVANNHRSLFSGRVFVDGYHGTGHGSGVEELFLDKFSLYGKKRRIQKEPRLARIAREVESHQKTKSSLDPSLTVLITNATSTSRLTGQRLLPKRTSTSVHHC